MAVTNERDEAGVATASSPRVHTRSVCAELVGSSSVVRRALDLVGRASAEDQTVLILAESGLDTTAVAREIHVGGPRADAPFVVVDCAALGPVRAEEILLGRAATTRGRRGPLEQLAERSALLMAAGGSLMLANVAELPASLQARLARVLRDGEVRVGPTGATTRLRTRLLASSSPSLIAEVEQGRFREDLYRRLARFQIDVPPLRDRSDDIPAIVSALVHDTCAAAGVPPPGFTQVALMLLCRLPWRENVHELRAFVERLVRSKAGPEIRLEDVLGHLRFDGGLGSPPPNGNLREARLRFEREYIAAVLRQHGWRMSAAARVLGIQRPNLHRKARQLGLVRPAGSGGSR